MIKGFLPFLVFLLIVSYFLLEKTRNGEILTKNSTCASEVLAQNSLTLNGSTFSVEIADTVPKRMCGLSYRKNLPPQTGMFFIFPEPGDQGFWMKGMNFPIDIIWFDKNFLVVDFKQSLDPSSYPEVFTPRLPAQYVLEVPSGTAGALNLQTGDQAKLADENLF